jgi:hypothetical protein
MKFRKKPVVIEAFKFLGPFSRDEMFTEWGFPFSDDSLYDEKTNILIIKTLEGNHYANIGDWIIKGVKGEFYPCKPDIFEETYEKEEEDNASN